jgi:hypothetical protein
MVTRDLDEAAEAARALADAAGRMLAAWDNCDGMDADLLDRAYADEDGETTLPDFREVAFGLRAFGREVVRIADGLGACEGCGEPGTTERPVRPSIVSPPVSGYAVDVGLYHESCAADAARAMVE